MKWATGISVDDDDPIISKDDSNLNDNRLGIIIIIIIVIIFNIIIEGIAEGQSISLRKDAFAQFLEKAKR